MAISFSAMRKKLEIENLCGALQGRIQYFATRYRKTHDSDGGVAIRVDRKVVFRSDFFKWARSTYRDCSQENREKSWEQINMEAFEKGCFDQYAFYKAFYEYDNQDIKISLESKNSIVRLFAILDKRVGKRTLEKLVVSQTIQPEWLQYFYQLRMQADGIGKPELTGG
jgi:hypothetical protein